MFHPYRFYWHDNGIEYFILYIDEENPSVIEGLLNIYKSIHEDTNKLSFMKFLQEKKYIVMESKDMIKESFLF